jgi:hypothetical protein
MNSNSKAREDAFAAKDPRDQDLLDENYRDLQPLAVEYDSDRVLMSSESLARHATDIHLVAMVEGDPEGLGIACGKNADGRTGVNMKRRTDAPCTTSFDG